MCRHLGIEMRATLLLHLRMSTSNCTANIRDRCSCATNLRDTLLVLPPEQRRPGDPTWVLSLEEKAFGLAILESEDFAVTTDVELALYFKKLLRQRVSNIFHPHSIRQSP
jgi:hypothetical protein